MTQNELFSVLATVFGVEKEKINIDSTIRNTDGWTSYTHLKMLIELSAIYGFEISPSIISTLVTVDEIYRFINENG